MPFHIHNNPTKEVLMRFAKSASVDAFHRLRVSTPSTIFDSKQTLDNLPLFWDDKETSGAGTGSTHSTDTASTVLSVTAATAGKRERATFRHFNYQSGKSQLVIMTGTLPGAAGITSEIGQFNAGNGLSFRNSGASGLQIVQRSSTTGSAVETVVDQADFNVDQMNGQGASKITFLPDFANIFWIAYEWLGAGTTLFGSFHDLAPIAWTRINNENSLSTVFMSTPNLPLRYTLEADGTNAAASMETICSTIASEGGIEPSGFASWETTATHVDATTAGVYYALIGMRLKSTHLGASIFPHHVSVGVVTADSVEWQLRFNPTVAGTPTYASAGANFAYETFKGATANTVTAGTVIDGGFAVSSGGGQAKTSETHDVQNNLILGSAIDGTVDTLVLCARPLTGSADVDIFGGLNVRTLA